MKSQDDRISDEMWEERMKSGDIEKWDKDHEFVLASIDSLNKEAAESAERGARYDKIFAVERTKWPHNMGSKMWDKIPNHLQKELDECITNSQDIAREACQTQELTDAYLLDNKVAEQ